METLICPYTFSCILYKNFAEKTRDRRVNVIQLVSDYSCLALEAHNDICGEGGITFSPDVSERIKTSNVQKNLNLGNVECSHITLLNLLKNN